MDRNHRVIKQQDSTVYNALSKLELLENLIEY